MENSGARSPKNSKNLLFIIFLFLLFLLYKLPFHPNMVEAKQIEFLFLCLKSSYHKPVIMSNPLPTFHLLPYTYPIMLDIKFIRENKDLVAAGAKKKHVDIDLDALIALDDKRKSVGEEAKRAEQNAANNAIVNAKSPAERQALIVAMKKVKDSLEKEEAELREVMKEWQIDDVARAEYSGHERARRQYRRRQQGNKSLG